MEILNKIKSVKLCLMAHPDNEIDSEFADRISDLEEIEYELSKDNWIKINSEEDLPKEKDSYWVVDKSGSVEKVTYHGKDDLSIRIWKTQFTHYHPIIKPDLPLT